MKGQTAAWASFSEKPTRGRCGGWEREVCKQEELQNSTLGEELACQAVLFPPRHLSAFVL